MSLSPQQPVFGWQIIYGTTENSPATFCGAPTDNLQRKLDTVGYVIEHIEVEQHVSKK